MFTSYKCNECDFGFISGFSHNERRYFAYCYRCGVEYAFRYMLSEWGISENELLVFERLKVKGAHKKKPSYKWLHTNQESNAISKTVEFQDRESLVWYPDVSQHKCVECDTHTIALSIEEGAECPKCSCGVIVKEGDVIF